MNRVDLKHHLNIQYPSDWELLESSGVGPFITRSVYRLPDGSTYVWESRRHRKGRGPRGDGGRRAITSEVSAESQGGVRWFGVWAPHRISWWVAIIFILGSILFTLGASSSLFPSVFGGTEIGTLLADASYWSGALLFTVGIYAQILEEINSSDYIGLAKDDMPEQRFRWFAWQPRRLGFMASFLLLIGSVLFNVETSLTLASSFGWLTLSVLIGLISMAGSLLFAGPCYMQVIEVCHSYFCIEDVEISWWVTILFVIGSLGFVIGSIFGLDVPGLCTPEETIVQVSYLAGSILFLIGSYLMLPEMTSQ